MTDDLDARIAQLQGLIGADEQALQPQQWGQQGQGSVFAGGQQQQQGFGGGFQRQGGDEKAPPRFAKDADDRSIFIAGLPKQDETAEELAQLFAPCGPIAKVTLLRDHTTNNLKGTAYIEFQTFEGAGRALDTMQQVQFRGAHALTVAKKRSNFRPDRARGGRGGRGGANPMEAFMTAMMAMSQAAVGRGGGRGGRGGRGRGRGRGGPFQG